MQPNSYEKYNKNFKDINSQAMIRYRAYTKIKKLNEKDSV